MPVIPGNAFRTQLASASASISAIASFLIVYTIFKSKKKTSDTLNRLLLGMSVSDIISSISIALGTIPVPRDTESFIYNMPYGNQMSCNVQGFSILVFSTMVPLYVTNLCVYYVAIIKFNVSADTMSRWIEPVLHIFSVAFCFVYGSVSLVKGYINPLPPYCYFAVYPNNCIANPDVECIRGSKEIMTFLGYFLLIRVSFSFLVILCSMGIIFFFVKKQEREISEKFPTMREQGKHTQSVKYQALGYITAYSLSFFFPFVSAILLVEGKPTNSFVSICSLVLYPLQGLFNFIVFIHPRIRNQRNGVEQVSYVRAIWNAIHCKEIIRRRSIRGS